MAAGQHLHTSCFLSTFSAQAIAFTLCLRESCWLLLLQMLVTALDVFRDWSIPWRFSLGISGLCQNRLILRGSWVLEDRHDRQAYSLGTGHSDSRLAASKAVQSQEASLKKGIWSVQRLGAGDMGAGIQADSLGGGAFTTTTFPSLSLSVPLAELRLRQQRRERGDAAASRAKASGAALAIYLSGMGKLQIILKDSCPSLVSARRGGRLMKLSVTAGASSAAPVAERNPGSEQQSLEALAQAVLLQPYAVQLLMNKYEPCPAMPSFLSSSSVSNSIPTWLMFRTSLRSMDSCAFCMSDALMSSRCFTGFRRKGWAQIRSGTAS